jgi:hypothetical protein
MHIVDYGLGYGIQWSGLLRVLAAREGSPPELVMITGMDLPQTAAACRSKMLSVASLCFEYVLSR